MLGGNTLFVLYLRFALVLFFSMVARVFFFVVNQDLFPELSVEQAIEIAKGGLKYDVAAALYLNILVILLHVLPFRFVYSKIYNNILLFIYLLFNTLLLISNFADTIYFRYTFKRTSFNIFKEFSSDSTALSAVWESVKLYPLVVLSAMLIIILFVLVSFSLKVHKIRPVSVTFSYVLNSILMLANLALVVGGIRGGFSHSTRPFTLSNASEYVTEPIHREIVLNTPFSIIRTTKVAKLEHKEYFVPEELATRFSALQRVDSLSAASTQRPNIVILIVESYGSEHIGAYNSSSTFTPFLDSLAAQSICFEQSFAGGLKSIEVLPSVLASVPSLVTPFILSDNSGVELFSLADIAKEQGYESHFFHGAPRGSMGFLAFTRQVGIDNYYGKEDFNDDSHYDGMWGIWDEEFLQYQVAELSKVKEPFISTTFTLSSHHPFKVPARYEGVFPKGPSPIHECVAYTDMALQQFFESAKKQDWYDNTIFIITADHTNQHYTPEFTTSVGRYKVPMIIYSPNRADMNYRDSTTVVQHADILPTVASLIGYGGEFISFGNNLLDRDKPHFSITYSGGVFQYIEGEYILQFDGDKSIALYNYIEDKLLATNLISTNKEVLSNMEEQLKAILQEYTGRITQNRMLPSK